MNSPVLPFGPRPRLNSSFYIGANEVFGKNWQKIWIKTGWKDRPSNFTNHYDNYGYLPFEDGTSSITDSSFKIDTALLENYQWYNDGTKVLFTENATQLALCPAFNPVSLHKNIFLFNKTDFPGLPYVPLSLQNIPTPPLTIQTAGHFLRMTLKGVSFQHDRYTYVLARHMMALADLVDPVSIDSAIKSITGFTLFNGTFIPGTDQLCPAITGKINLLIPEAAALSADIATMGPQIFWPFPANALNQLSSDLSGYINTAISNIGIDDSVVSANLNNAVTVIADINNLITSLNTTNNNALNHINNIRFWLDNPVPNIDDLVPLGGVKQLAEAICDRLDNIRDKLKVNQALKTGLPTEPYTPTIKELELDYTAVAKPGDILLTHLYPYEQTSKAEALALKPTLLPTFADEGTLFIGLKDLSPGAILSLLFQLAESTADSESNRADLRWSYLSGNRWNPLRTGFDIIDDRTEGVDDDGYYDHSIAAGYQR
ncbi:MAG: hypothetical protein IPH12_14055 [Saprospirales bacterium]|nr:hypothetical protein [Saprospirales bacterium]